MAAPRWGRRNRFVKRNNLPAIIKISGYRKSSESDDDIMCVPLLAGDTDIGGHGPAKQSDDDDSIPSLLDLNDAR